MISPSVSRNLVDGGQFDTFAGPVRLATVPAAGIVIVSGRVAAFDAAYPADARPFTDAFPTGEFPVLLSMARYKDKDQRIAAARIQFADALVAEWKPARPETYGVDSGFGCFADAEAVERLTRGGKGQRDCQARLASALQRNHADTRSFGAVVIDPRSGANLVAFSSGFGDGGYGSYLGFDKKGRLACLLTDFGLLLTQEEIDEMDEVP